MKLKVYCSGLILNLESDYSFFKDLINDLNKLGEKDYMRFKDDAVRKDQILRIERR